ncbi:MAG: hypothetical protein MZV70_59690 [Desulfobacterales bacterium]|nr:hypothetical protein [Desulfobacterales bacterium]
MTMPLISFPVPSGTRPASWTTSSGATSTSVPPTKASSPSSTTTTIRARASRS